MLIRAAAYHPGAIMAQTDILCYSRKREYLADCLFRSVHPLSRRPGIGIGKNISASNRGYCVPAKPGYGSMYIINPLHKKGRRLPTLPAHIRYFPERIRILRAMGGDSLLHQYDEALPLKLHGKGNVIP